MYVFYMIFAKKRVLFLLLFFSLLSLLLLLWEMYITFANRKGVKYGFENNTRNYGVIFAGTVRNAENYIQGALENIEKCGQKFNTFSVVIYENDSNDKTRDILLQNKRDNYHYLFEDNVPEGRRTMRLANGRNRILQKVKEINSNNQYTYLIMLDLDDVNASGEYVKSIDSCFQHDITTWDVLTGNQRGKYYDLWALRQKGYIEYDVLRELDTLSPEDETYHKFHNIIDNTHFDKSADLIEVDSAFGGIAVYRLAAIQNCEYVGEHLNDEYPDHSEHCEHVEFHKCIKKNGGKMYINSEFYTD